MVLTLIFVHSSQLIMKRMDLYPQSIKFNSIINVFTQFIIFLHLLVLLFILFFLDFQNHPLINDLILHRDYYSLFVLMFFDFGKLHQIYLLTVFCHFFFAFRQILVLIIEVNFDLFFILLIFLLLWHLLLLILLIFHQYFPLLFHPFFTLLFYFLLFILPICFQIFLRFHHLFAPLHHLNFQSLLIHFLNLFLQPHHQFQEIINYHPIFILNLFTVD